MRILRVLAAIALASVAADCGGAGGSDGYGPTTPTGGGNPPATNTNQITIADLSFSPGAVTVPTGTTVTWNWNDCAGGSSGGYAGCISHNVTFDDGSSVASATQTTGSFSRTFNAAGTFRYHRTIHGGSMSGQVVVK